jgi:hypothetical protein
MCAAGAGEEFFPRAAPWLAVDTRRSIVILLSATMRRLRPVLLLALALPSLVAAAPPAAQALALEPLRDQKSYSWEIINLDPGPVAQDVKTRRGTVTTVTVSTAPNVKGRVDLNGDLLLVREWADGLRLETYVTAKGAMITKTPEGWLTNQEILTAQAEERMKADTATERAIWLRRADRPDVRRPDEELLPLLQSAMQFEEIAPDTFVGKGVIRSGSPKAMDEEDAAPAYQITVTLYLKGGVIRNYDVAIEGTRRVARSRIAVSDNRSVVLTYVPIARVPVPAEAKEKLKALRP